MNECAVLLGMSFVVIGGLLVWIFWLYMKLLGAGADSDHWRQKAIIGEVFRSRDAYARAVEDEAQRPREYDE